MGEFKNMDWQATVARIACFDRFIPTVRTSDSATSHLTGETTSQSTKPPKNGGKVAGYKPAKYAGRVIDETTSHLTKAASCQVIGYGYSHSTKLPNNGNQVAGYVPLKREFFTYVLPLCCAAKPRFQYWTALIFRLAETRFLTGLAYDFVRAGARNESVSPDGALGRDLSF
jgi:hypothetical protein